MKKVTDAQVIRYCLQQFKILISLTSELDGFVLLNKPVKKLLSRHLSNEIDQSILGFKLWSIHGIAPDVSICFVDCTRTDDHPSSESTNIPDHKMPVKKSFHHLEFAPVAIESDIGAISMRAAFPPLSHIFHCSGTIICCTTPLLKISNIFPDIPQII